MKKLQLLFFLFTVILCSCASRRDTYDPVVSNFPLNQNQILPVNDLVKRIAVADTWIAIYTPAMLRAVDINTQETLWQMNLEVQEDDELGLQVVDDTLIAIATNQVFLINRSGEKTELTLESPNDPIIKLVAFYPDYVYIIRFPDWRLEAYSVSQNKRLWTVQVGRGGANVFYEELTNVAYVTTRENAFFALDNTTGKMFWRQDRSSLYSVFEHGIIYTVERDDGQNQYLLSAFDAERQEELWVTDVSFGSHAYNLSLVNKFLIVSGNEGLLALDKSNGAVVWQTTKGEEFQTKPVELGSVIYAKAISLKVYAVSPVTGEFIGFVSLEEPSNPHPMYELLSGVYEIDNGILFNTRDAVVIYKSK